MSYVYAAIGHFKGSENTTCVASTNLTKKAFQDDLRDRLMSLDGLDRWEQVKKLTSNYRKWRELDDYIEQCGDIIASKMQAAREVEYMA